MNSTHPTLPERHNFGFLTPGAPLRTWHECLPWLLAIAACNILLLLGDGHGSDLGYWKNWVSQLQVGYSEFSGDYPPGYIHWLYLVGKFYSIFAIPLEADCLLKFLAQLPVLGSHLVLALLVTLWAQRYHISATTTHAVLALVCFNPALLIDGPLWGQVDLLPITLAVSALTLAVVYRRMDLALPLYLLSLLVKFQMIAFLPVFGVLGLQQFRKSLWGVGWSVLLAALVFLPFIVAGTAKQTFINAYVHTVGSYPYATFNAANLWLLWVGNISPDDLNLITGQRGGFWSVKHVGMLLFAALCLVVFVLAVWRQLCGRLKGVAAAREWLLYALITNLAFFTLLPAMHERYLLPSVVVVLMYALLTPAGYLLALLLGSIAAINMMLVYGVSGELLWLLLSCASVLVFIVLLFNLLLGHKCAVKVWLTVLNWLNKPWLVCLLLLLMIGAAGSFLVRAHAIDSPTLESNQRLLHTYPLLYSRQTHGQMRINRSYDNNVLSVSGKRYSQGLGVHARSKVTFALPDNALRFSAMVGLDDEVKSAEIEFFLQGDGAVLWRSGPVYGYEKEPITVDVNVQGVSKLSLLVDPRGSDNGDHGNWIYPIITLDQ